MMQCLSLKKMIENFQKLKLENIVLTFKDVRCEKPRISEFLAAFERFAASLKALSLSFNLHHGSGGMVNDYTGMFKYFKHLKHLNLNFNLEVNRIYLPRENNPSDIQHQKEIIKAINTGWNLKEQPNINLVKFKFLIGKLVFKEPESFIEFIKEITTGDLRFVTDITYNYTKNLQFANHFYLETQRNSPPRLSLTCNMKDDNIQEISNFFTFLKPIQNLYSFHLGFNWDDSRYQINENSIQHLMKNLQQLPSVTGFTLNLKKCFRIDEGLFEQFCSYLLDLQAIDELNLDFSGCIQISDNCLVSLGDTMMKMRNLKKLSLIFDECYLIQNEGIKALAVRLLTMKSLQYVKINCDECFKINLGEKGLLFSLLQSLPKSEIRLNKILINDLS